VAVVLAALLAAGCGGGRQSRSPESTRPAATTPQNQGGAGPAPVRASWQRLASAPTERTEVTAAVLGQDIYVVGGYRRDGGTVPTVEIYDTRAQRWRQGPALPLAVNHAMSATVDGEVHVFGGYSSDGKPSASAFRLDGGAWRRVPDLPSGRAAGTAVAIGGTVYLAGGVGPQGLASSMLVYDAAGQRWSLGPGPPTPREHLGGAGSAGKLSTVGGRVAGRGDLGAVEVFDPATSRWTALAPLRTPRGGLGATATAGGLVVAAGGEPSANRTTTFAEADAFDVRVGTWRSLPPMPTPRHGLGVAAVGDVVYTLAGGPQPGLHVASTVEAIDLGRPPP
jgi:hypothetical protein